MASLVRFCSFQFTLISTRSGKSVCASPCLQDVFINAAFQTFVSVDTVCDMVDKAINAASFKEILIHAYKITITYINSDTSRVDETENHSGKYSIHWYWTPESRDLTERMNMDVQGALQRSSTCEST